jgi:hypothetical protein
MRGVEGEVEELIERIVGTRYIVSVREMGEGSYSCWIERSSTEWEW